MKGKREKTPLDLRILNPKSQICFQTLNKPMCFCPCQIANNDPSSNTSVSRKRSLKLRGKFNEESSYLVRSKKRVPVMNTSNVTWNINKKSLEEKAKPSIAARQTPNIKNAILSVFQVGPCIPNNNKSSLFALK